MLECQHSANVIKERNEAILCPCEHAESTKSLWQIGIVGHIGLLY